MSHDMQIVAAEDRASRKSPLLVARSGLNIRPATMEDLAFIDQLQKQHTKQVGWMPTKQLEGKIKLGHVLIAEKPSPLPSPGVPGEGATAVGYAGTSVKSQSGRGNLKAQDTRYKQSSNHKSQVARRSRFEV